MAFTKQGKVILVGVILLPITGIGLLFVHWFVYPFVSANPNFADVEAVFNELEIPDDWVLVSESENRGIAGRQCPVESATVCFSKSANYTVDKTVTKEDVRFVVLSSGCVSTSEKDESQEGSDKESFTFVCMMGGARVLGSWSSDEGVVKAGIGVRSE